MPLVYCFWIRLGAPRPSIQKEDRMESSDRLAAFVDAHEELCAAAAAPQEIVTEIHEHALPAFVETELERLYAHIFSTVLQMRTYDELDGQVSTYVARSGGRIRSVFLFRQEGTALKVLNQGLPIGDEDARRFADAVFARYPEVRRIAFHAVRSQVAAPGYPCQQYNCSDDIVIRLPPSADAYLASLGKNTRRNVKRYMERLKRSFPSFECRFHEREAIADADIDAIIGFNRARMAGKNKQSTLDELEASRIRTLTRASGLVSVARIEGRVVAGGIAYRVGDNFFLYVIAHDPAYDDYWIGILTCYLTICECIARGGKNFHFLWGRYDYKFLLGSVLHELSHVDLYRSRLDYLRNGPAIARQALRQHIAAAKFKLLDEARRQDSLAFRVVSRLRKARRVINGLLHKPARK
jgi:hypothetical protein